MSKPQQHKLQHSSAAQTRALKKKLRALRWQPEAVMREVLLIQKLRALVGEGR